MHATLFNNQRKWVGQNIIQILLHDTFIVLQEINIQQGRHRRGTLPSQIRPYNTTFNFDLKLFWNWSFSIMKKLWDLKKVLGNLEQDKGVALLWEWHAYFS